VFLSKTPFSYLFLSSSASLYQTTFYSKARYRSLVFARKLCVRKMNWFFMPLWSFVCVFLRLCGGKGCMVERELARERVSGTPTAVVAALIWSHDV
jgi:hypothetical protein